MVVAVVVVVVLVVVVDLLVDLTFLAQRDLMNDGDNLYPGIIIIG